MIDIKRTIIVIAICAGITFGERALPFILFRKGKIPSSINYLGKVLGPAVMVTLLVYCLRNVSFSEVAYWLPQLGATILTGALYLWKSNTMIAILGGTILCMVLTQTLC